MTYGAILLGGGLGAALRFGLSRIFAPWSSVIPLGTLVANLSASFVSALTVSATGAGAAAHPLAAAFWQAGVAGGLSTFSTFAYETFVMIQERDYTEAALNVGLNLAGGLAFAVLGTYVGGAVAG